MKFTRKRLLTDLTESKTYKGVLHAVDKVTLKKGSYYDIKIEMPEGIVSIWVTDDVTPDHPMFEIFDYYIENEEEAEDFDENEICGCPVKFRVKSIVLENSKKPVKRYFFEKIEIDKSRLDTDEALDNEDETESKD